MFVSPEKVIEDLGIMPRMLVADFGCGSGHYSIAAAKRVGKEGKVYALDIQKEMLEMVRAQAKLEHLDNIETVWTDLENPESSRLKENSVDLVIISNLLFQVENKKQIVNEAHRIIKTGGKAVVIEWTAEEKKIGPPLDARINPEEAKKLFEEAGFSLEKEFNPGENHYGLIFKRK